MNGSDFAGRGFSKFLSMVALFSVLVGSNAWAGFWDDFGSDQSAFANPEQSEIQITTFNIAWYGLGGDPKSNKGEYRDPQLSRFIEQEMGASEVIVFEEIVDINRLARSVLGGTRNCYSYDHSDPTHQHVVICVKPSFQFVPDYDDDNYALESVADGSARLRPATHGILQSADGRPLLRIIGTHLKAFPDGFDQRMRQSKAISEHLRTRTDGLPVVLTGDFNTHEKEQTKQKHDDVDFMTAIFEASGLGYVVNPFRFTFRIPQAAHQLDHFWLSHGMQALWMNVGKVCNNMASMNVAEPDFDFKGKKGDKVVEGSFEDLTFYNHWVSDHCPVTTRIRF